jgi:hypothetical protein
MVIACTIMHSLDADTKELVLLGLVIMAWKYFMPLFMSIEATDTSIIAASSFVLMEFHAFLVTECITMVNSDIDYLTSYICINYWMIFYIGWSLALEFSDSNIFYPVSNPPP